MATYVIGDVQGCHFSFLNLLKEISFSCDKDKLIFVGDLVNRGRYSLEFLEWCFDNQKNLNFVLGNHDLHLMAIYFGQRPLAPDDTLDRVLESSSIQMYIDWLLEGNLSLNMKNYFIVHAGLYPNWTMREAYGYGLEVMKSVRENPKQFFKEMYGNKPIFWSKNIKPVDHQRFVVNVMTRMRFLKNDLSLDFTNKGPYSSDSKIDSKAWFLFERKKYNKKKIISGHWSAIGLEKHAYGISIDTGCVWGNKLTAFCLEKNKIYQVKADSKDLI
jgi:bis(5'-nucleosyl)-tetraphosphatase (symmetrical)